MASYIIGDAKYQELNMSFTFDQNYQGKLIIDALAENVPYRIQLESNPYIDFQDLKNSLASKHFKLISKSNQILKLKIGVTSLEFKSVEINPIESFKQAVQKLTNSMNKQFEKNTFIEAGIKQLKNNFNLIEAKFADLVWQNDQKTRQVNEVKTDMSKYQNEVKNLKQELNGNKNKINSQEQKIKSQQEKIQRQGGLIEELQSIVSRLDAKMTTISEKQTLTSVKSQQKKPGKFIQKSQFDWKNHVINRTERKEKNNMKQQQRIRRGKEVQERGIRIQKHQYNPAHLNRSIRQREEIGELVNRSARLQEDIQERAQQQRRKDRYDDSDVEY